MSRFAEVIVIAKDAEHIMEPIARRDPNQQWYQCFTKVGEDLRSGSIPDICAAQMPTTSRRS